MTIDKTKYTYHPLGDGAPFNMQLELLIDVPMKSWTMPSVEFRQFIIALANKKPAWTFVFKGANPSNFLRNARVYADKEFLGIIAWTYERNDYGFGIDSPKLEAARQRGNLTFTKDAKKAELIIRKNFAPEALSNKIETAHRAAANAAFAIHGQRRGKKQAHDATLAPFLLSYALDNHAVVMPVLVADYKLSPYYPAQYLDVVEKMGEAARLMGMDGRAVFLHNGGYYVRTEGKDGGLPNVETYSSETLPENLRGNIGMLKLVTDGTFIPDVGVRVKENVLYVLLRKP